MSNFTEMFIYDVIADSKKLRMRAMKNLSKVASSLGIDKTRTVIIPFIFEVTKDSEDPEILAELSKQTVELARLVGMENSTPLISQLVYLLSVDEKRVQKETLKSLQFLASERDDVNFQSIFLPLLDDMVAASKVGSRISACGLITMWYSRAPLNTKIEFRGKFNDLCKDDNSKVRSEAANKLGEFCEVIGAALITVFIIPLFEKLAEDREACVREEMFRVVSKLTNRMSNNDIKQLVIPAFLKRAKDQSWRIRLLVSKQAKKMLITNSDLKDAIMEVTAALENRKAGVYNRLSNELEIKIGKPIQIPNISSSSESSPESRPLTQTKRKMRANPPNDLSPNVKKTKSDSLTDYNKLKANCKRLIADTTHLTIALLFMANYCTPESLAGITADTITVLQDYVMDNVERLVGINNDAYSFFNGKKAPYIIDEGLKRSILTLGETARNVLKKD